MVCFMSQALIVYYIKAVPTHYQYNLLKSKMISQLLSFCWSKTKYSILFLSSAETGVIGPSLENPMVSQLKSLENFKAFGSSVIMLRFCRNHKGLKNDFENLRFILR